MAAQIVWLESPTLAEIIDFVRNYLLHISFTELLEDRDAYAFFWGLASFAFTASAHNNRIYPEFNWVQQVKWAVATGQINLPTPRIIVNHSATQVPLSTTNNGRLTRRATIRAGNASFEQSTTRHHVSAPIASNSTDNSNSQAPNRAVIVSGNASSEQSTTPHGNSAPSNPHSANSPATSTRTNSTQNNTNVPDAAAASEGDPSRVLQDFAQWSNDPRSFWDQSAKPLRLKQATYMERFRVFLARAMNEGPELHTQTMLTANIETSRGYHMQSQLEMRICQYRFTCVLAYKFWARFSRGFKSHKSYKLVAYRVREFLRMAGLSQSNEHACSNVLWWGGRRHEFCARIQPDREDVDYGPLLRADLPDAM
jgi:hypothetical protein